MNEVQTINDQSLLIDECTIEGLLNFPVFKAGYEVAHAEYEVDYATVNLLNPLMKDIKITVVFGTWCGDSLRQVPILLKVLEALEIAGNNIKIIGVDLTKRTINYPIADLQIEKVPTVILYKDGVELGRIVETPIETFEKDIYYLLTNE